MDSYENLIQKWQTGFEVLTLRIEGSGSGHWTGRSLSRGSVGCSTGLNSTATSIPWGATAAATATALAAPVTSEFEGNTSLSSCNTWSNSLSNNNYMSILISIDRRNSSCKALIWSINWLSLNTNNDGHLMYSVKEHQSILATLFDYHRFNYQEDPWL